jgi:uncharacterized protein YlzI (FlbEa/FlbD family)
MSRFVRLTETNGSPIMVNMDLIESFYQKKPYESRAPETVLLGIGTEGNEYYVTESPQYIVELLGLGRMRDNL